MDQLSHLKRFECSFGYSSNMTSCSHFLSSQQWHSKALSGFQSLYGFQRVVNPISWMLPRQWFR